MTPQRSNSATVSVGVAFLALAFAAAQEGRTATVPQKSNESMPREQLHILVAPAVNVSQANSLKPHFEVQIAADPTSTKRLIACSMQLGSDDMDDGQTYLRPHPNNVVVYLSVDGGLSWRPTYTVDRHQQNLDPSCAFGPDGTAYFMSFGGDVYELMSRSYRESESKGTEIFSNESKRSFYRTLMFRSTDGGKTWIEVNAQELIDRDYITIDDTTGKHRGRLYVHGLTNGSTGIDGSRFHGLAILRSTDRGQTFESVKLADEGTQFAVDMANGIVMSDGTFATLFTDASDKTALLTSELHPASPNAKLKFVSSEDGGETFNKATIIGDSYWPSGQVRTTIHSMPSLAVDRTEGPFHDRLYAAWVDVRSGRGEIRFARSENKGLTWLPSFVISDNWPRDERGETPDAFLPALAVNRKGVLGVMWYDRRDHPDNLGYDIRFSASLDGGESFLPSVLVSTGGGSALQMREALMRGPLFAFAKAGGRAHAGFTWSVWDYGSDTVGMACDLDGTFHPLWSDRRSGIQQLSTTRVTVDGTAMLNGGGGLETLQDLSAKTQVRYSVAHLNLGANEITIGATITNISDVPISGPFILRLLGLSSSSGLIEAQNADNGMTTGGAVWEFHTVSSEALQPGASTVPRQLRFKLAHAPFPPTPLQLPFDRDLIGIDTKILGNTNVNPEKMPGH
jgi:hypothetical protein